MPRWGLAVVRGRSMAPTLLDGDRLLVRYAGRLRPGAVAVVVLPDGVLAIKRLAFAQDGHWWVERDNPLEGIDSWSVGAIPTTDVRAIAVCVLWPLAGLWRWLTAGSRATQHG